MLSIAFCVDGTPAPKGSFNVYPGKKGGRPNGRESSKRYPPWRKLIEAKARTVMDGLPLIEPPYSVGLTFYVHRPKAPKYPWPGSLIVGDIDKLTRGVLDALKGIVIVDDAHVVRFHEQSKRYVRPGQEPGCAISIRHVDPLDY